MLAGTNGELAAVGGRKATVGAGGPLAERRRARVRAADGAASAPRLARASRAGAQAGIRRASPKPHRNLRASPAMPRPHRAQPLSAAPRWPSIAHKIL
ncbi:hypothetical protein GCM10022416_37370 [Actinomadura keratinilytica]|uniref:Uncharacterized protein n=1 Tax=Actinomadura keratinilytica TaxID=547461 RepID=A0ABP7Z2B3_9ACTN